MVFGALVWTPSHHIECALPPLLWLALKSSLRHCLNLEDYPCLQTVPFGTSSGRRHFPGGMTLAGTETAKGLLKRSIMVFWHYHSGVLRYNEARKAWRARVIMNITQNLNCYLWKNIPLAWLNQVRSL